MSTPELYCLCASLTLAKVSFKNWLYGNTSTEWNVGNCIDWILNFSMYYIGKLYLLNPNFFNVLEKWPDKVAPFVWANLFGGPVSPRSGSWCGPSFCWSRSNGISKENSRNFNWTFYSLLAKLQAYFYLTFRLTRFLFQ